VADRLTDRNPARPATGVPELTCSSSTRSRHAMKARITSTPATSCPRSGTRRLAGHQPNPHGGCSSLRELESRAWRPGGPVKGTPITATLSQATLPELTPASPLPARLAGTADTAGLGLKTDGCALPPASTRFVTRRGLSDDRRVGRRRNRGRSHERHRVHRPSAKRTGNTWASARLHPAIPEGHVAALVGTQNGAARPPC